MKALPKDGITFKGFILLNSMLIVLNSGKISRGVEFEACQKYWSTLLRLLITLDLFLSAGI